VNNVTYHYRVHAIGEVVGDTGTPNFPTMSADSVSEAIAVTVGTPASTEPPVAPSGLTAESTGAQVVLTWTDNAIDETGFVLERCTAVGTPPACSNFAQIAAPGPAASTGSVTYTDTAVTAGTSYLYQVKAVNANGASAYATLAGPVTVAALPAAPTNATIAVVKNATGNRYTGTINWVYGANPTSFTIQRATNLDFTANLNTSTVTGDLRTAVQTLNRNTTYYFRIRANTAVGSSAWTTVLPFPIRTGR
jgi:hypothetical protein